MISQELDRKPISSEKTELAFVSCVLLKPDIFPHVEIKPHHFYDPVAQECMEMFSLLNRDGKPIDIVLLVSLARDRDTFDLIGGESGLASIANEQATAAHWQMYQAEVFEKWQRRQLTECALNDLRKASDTGLQVDDILDSSLAARQRIGEAQVWGPKAIDYSSMLEEHPEMKPHVIHGLLRECETLNLIAAPKVGKSFLVLGMAWCVATGRHWLSHDVEQGPVLLVDNELHKNTLCKRINDVAFGLQIPHEERRGKLDVISLRGHLCDIHGLQRWFSGIKPGKYKLVIIDALYRLLPVGTSENDNAAMTAIYNKLDQYAEQLQCSIVVVHHSSKGNQGEKGVTDVGAGAGAISRAADSHVTIRHHETEGHAVLEAVRRSDKKPDPLTITFEYPVWHASTLEPVVKRVTSGRADPMADQKAVKELAEAIPESGWIQQEELFENAAIGAYNRSKRLADLMVKDGLARRKKEPKAGGKKELVLYSKPKVTSKVASK